MIVEIELTWQDYLNAVRLHMRPGPVLRNGGAALVVLSVLIYSYLVVKVFHRDVGSSLILPVSLSSACLLSWYFLYLPHTAKRFFGRQKVLQEPFKLEIVADGLEYSSEVASAHLTWDYFPKWKENERLFLLYHSDVLFQVIPKSSFNDERDMNSFRDVLTANVRKVD